MKVRFHPMKGTNKSSLVLLSKKSGICDKLVNASNLKLWHQGKMKVVNSKRRLKKQANYFEINRS